MSMIFLALWAAVHAEAPAGLLVTSRASGLHTDARGKLPGMLIRCGLNVTPAGQPLIVHLPRAQSASFSAVLQGTLGWSQEAFERQRVTFSARAGRDCYEGHSSDAEVLAAVRANPGAVGVVSGAARLTEEILVLWPPEAEPLTPEPAPAPPAPAPDVAPAAAAPEPGGP